MLDFDLAELYEDENRALKQATSCKMQDARCKMQVSGFKLEVKKNNQVHITT